MARASEPHRKRRSTGFVEPFRECSAPAGACAFESATALDLDPLATVSAHSAAGSESETIPAPNCTITRPPATIAVRMTTDRSVLPRQAR